MKTLGIIGGIGPESTIEYYRLIIAAYREQKQDGSYPSIIINSVNLKRIVDWMGANELASVAEYLVAAVRTLTRAGADFGLIAANTPHIVFDEVRSQSPIPLISIVQATCDAAKLRGLTRLALFGTRYTMQGRFYPDIFAQEGITLVTPNQNEQTYIHDKYMNELVDGIILPETRARLLAIVDHLKERESIQGLILGGTELSLILREDTASGVPVLDTAKIHARSAVQQLLG